MTRTTRRGLLLTLLIGGLVLGAIAIAGALNHASPRVAFMGDSLTENWSFPRVNLGKHGQTTAQMLARFDHQIKCKGFRLVIILGGTNDTLLGVDPAETLHNLGVMVDHARAAGVEPVLVEIPPIFRQSPAGLQYPAAVARLNEGIVSLAREKQVKLVDLFHPLLAHPEEYSDGVHFKRRAYLRYEYALADATDPF